MNQENQNPEFKEKYNKLINENEELKYIIATSNIPCLYCGLPNKDMNKCIHGFPGCGRMDDINIKLHEKLNFLITKNDKL